MAEERDPAVPQEVSARYRELGMEEPPRALDEAILAAARRGASARPASLDRAQRRRWYGPLAAAAVLVLAVGVALHVENERPEMVASRPQAPAPQPKAALDKPAAEAAPAAAAKADVRQAPARRKEAAPEQQPTAVASSAAAPEPFPAAAPAPVAARAMVREEVAGAPAMTPPPSAAPKPAAAPLAEKSAQAAGALSAAGPSQGMAPERELERVAALRAEGRHDEADKALAEFRKKHPGYRIPEETLKKVERR
jgi:translation initiation factor IF-2